MEFKVIIIKHDADFIHKYTCITWLPCVVFFSHYLLRLVCDVTCYVIFIMRLLRIMRNFRAKVLMKFNAPDDLLSK